VFGLKTGVRTYSQWATYGPQSSGNWTSSSSTFLKINWPATTMKKKTLRETQTLHTGCSKVEPKIFTPLQTPFLVGQDGQKLISWRWSPPSPTNPVWWGSMHTISSYRGNRPTNKHTHTHKPTDRTDYSFTSTQCIESRKWHINYAQNWS